MRANTCFRWGCETALPRRITMRCNCTNGHVQQFNTDRSRLKLIAANKRDLRWQRWRPVSTDVEVNLIKNHKKEGWTQWRVLGKTSAEDLLRSGFFGGLGGRIGPSAHQPILIRRFYWYDSVDYLLRVSFSDAHLTVVCRVILLLISTYGLTQLLQRLGCPWTPVTNNVEKPVALKMETRRQKEGNKRET